MTDRQYETLSNVEAANTTGRWYRAGGACGGCAMGGALKAGEHAPRCGSGERVTLASLWRRGLLARRAWRGIEGDPDAAHEYRIAGRRYAVLG